MWEKLLMNVSCLSAIILALVGLAKFPFKKFKVKFPKWYKATFFLLSLVFVAGGSVVAQLYIIGGALVTWDFAILILGTAVVVLGGYQGYECTSLKDGLRKLFLKLKTWLTTYSDSKVAKFIDKVGKARIDAIANTMVIETVEIPVSETNQVEQEVSSNAENISVEPTVTIEEKKEGV